MQKIINIYLYSSLSRCKRNMHIAYSAMCVQIQSSQVTVAHSPINWSIESNAAQTQLKLCIERLRTIHSSDIRAFLCSLLTRSRMQKTFVCDSIESSKYSLPFTAVTLHFQPSSRLKSLKSQLRHWQRRPALDLGWMCVCHVDSHIWSHLYISYE